MKKEIAKYLLLVMLALGAGPAGAAIWNWSMTAGNNGTADPTINWAEGMAPSSVNDSARAMMARVAEWRSDISGALTTGGTSTAYTVTTNEGFPTTPNNGQMLSVVPAVTNGLAPTLQVDGGTAYPIWSGGVAIGAGTMVAGTPYRLTFSVANSAYLLEGGQGNPYSTPLGGMIISTADTPPNSNFAIPYGQCISRTTYAAYFAQVGTRFGGCDGSTTFAMADMRGRLPAGLDNLGGSAAGRLTSSSNGCGTAFTTVGANCANGGESQTLTALQIPSITSSGSNSISVNNSGGNGIAATSTPGNVSFYSVANAPGGPVAPTSTAGTWTGSASMSGTNNISVTSGNTGGQPHPQVMPVLGVTYFVRII